MGSLMKMTVSSGRYRHLLLLLLLASQGVVSMEAPNIDQFLQHFPGEMFCYSNLLLPITRDSLKGAAVATPNKYKEIHKNNQETIGRLRLYRKRAPLWPSEKMVGTLCR